MVDYRLNENPELARGSGKWITLPEPVGATHATLREGLGDPTPEDHGDPMAKVIVMELCIIACRTKDIDRLIGAVKAAREENYTSSLIGKATVKMLDKLMKVQGKQGDDVFYDALPEEEGWDKWADKQDRAAPEQSVQGSDRANAFPSSSSTGWHMVEGSEISAPRAPAKKQSSNKVLALNPDGTKDL